MGSLLAVIGLFGAGFIIGGSVGMKWGYDAALEKLDQMLKKITND